MSEEEKVDYLDVDDPINGQSHVCLSFISPDELIHKKDAFNVTKFLQSYCKDLKLEFKEVYSKYEDFVYKFSAELQRDFDEKNKFQTNMRGIKVRGIFGSRGEAEARAKKLQSIDSIFNVFVGDVGKWLPWDPCADNVGDEVFQNSQLNDMMEKYQENNINKDIFYEEQKRDKVKAAREEVLKKQREAAEQEALKKVDEGDKTLEDMKKDVEDTKEEKTKEEETEETEETEEEETKEEETDKTEKTEEIVHKLDGDMKASLENVDPWLANKLQQKSGVNSEPETEVSTEVSTEAETEVDTEVSTEVDTEVDTNESKNC